MATQKQIEEIDMLLSHVKANAIEVIDNTRIDNQAVFNQLIKAGFSFLKKQSAQSLVDIGALGLAYKIRTERLTEK